MLPAHVEKLKPEMCLFQTEVIHFQLENQQRSIEFGHDSLSFLFYIPI